jgi:hypothetical protein
MLVVLGPVQEGRGTKVALGWAGAPGSRTLGAVVELGSLRAEADLLESIFMKQFRPEFTDEA